MVESVKNHQQNKYNKSKNVVVERNHSNLHWADFWSYSNLHTNLTPNPGSTNLELCQPNFLHIDIQHWDKFKVALNNNNFKKSKIKGLQVMVA